MGDAPTAAQLAALKWLRNRNADGVFDRNQVLVAGGERAGVMRGTWSALERLEMVERYHDRRRLRVTDFGMLANLDGIAEASSAAEEYGL
jgi:hypothetical protein